MSEKVRLAPEDPEYGATVDLDPEDPKCMDGNTDRKATLFASLICIACLAEGYDYGVTNGAIVRMKEDLNLSTLESAIFVTAMTFSIMFGAPLGGVFGDYFGRKVGLLTQCFALSVGPILTAIAPNIWMMTIARLATGFGIGMGVVIVSMYISEMSPMHLRGRLTALEDVWINSGILLGYLVSYLLLGVKNDWRWMIGLGCVPTLILGAVILLTQVPESPRWLYMQGRLDEAHTVLQRFMSPTEVERIMMDYQDSQNEKFATWNELLCPGPEKAYVRRMLVASVFVATANAACGALVLGYYSSTLLAKEFSLKLAQLATVIMGAVKLVVVILVILFAMDRVGRRPLLLLSTIITGLSCVWIACAFWLSWGWLMVAMGFWLFHVGLSLGQGPLAWVYCSEAFPTAFRAKGMGLSFLLRGVLGVTMVFLFPLVAEEYGNILSFVGLAIVNAIFLVILWLVVFETATKSLEQMHTAFQH